MVKSRGYLREVTGDAYPFAGFIRRGLNPFHDAMISAALENHGRCLRRHIGSGLRRLGILGMKWK